MVFYGVVVGCKFFFLGGIGKIEPKKAQENSFFKKEGDEHGCLLLFNYRWKTLSYIYLVEVCFALVFFCHTSDHIGRTEAEASCLAIKHGQCDPCHKCK